MTTIAVVLLSPPPSMIVPLLVIRPGTPPVVSAVAWRGAVRGHGAAGGQGPRGQGPACGGPRAPHRGRPPVVAGEQAVPVRIALPVPPSQYARESQEEASRP